MLQDDADRLVVHRIVLAAAAAGLAGGLAAVAVERAAFEDAVDVVRLALALSATTASTMPNMIALGRWSEGRPAAASAISTALSPDSTRLTPRILISAAQSQLANRVSIGGRVSLLIGAEAPAARAAGP